MSLLTDTGIPSKVTVLSIFGITTLALVEVTNSTSAHLDFMHSVTSILASMDGVPKVYSNIF